MPKGLIINTILGTIIAVFLTPYYEDSFLMVWLVSQVITQITGMTVVIFGYYMSQYKNPASIPGIISLSALSGAAAFLASLVAFFIISLVLEPLFKMDAFSSSDDFIGKVSIPAFFIATILKAVERLSRHNQKKTANISSESIPVSVNQSYSGNDVLSFRSAGEYRLVPCSEILYLSSDNMKTVIHTSEEDYIADHLLKNLAEKLPENTFMRIHKRFIINLSMINRLQYLAGGAYMAHLKDDDDTQVIVGRSYAPLLKARLNIS